MKNLIVTMIAAVLFAGCSEDKRTVVHDDSLITVSGHVLTREKADQMLAAQLATSRNPKAARAKLVASIDQKFTFDCLISDYARENGIAVSPEKVTQQARRIMSRKRGLKRELVPVLEEMVRNELTAREVSQAFKAKQKVEIPAEEVRRRREIFERINRTAQETNAVTYASATNCWRRIVKGEISFAKALEVYDQSEGEKDSEGYWGEFSLDAFPEEEVQLRNMLPQMNPGDITPPLAGDNGLIIVKLLGTGVNANNQQSMVPTKTYRLARVFFHLCETCEAQSDAELERDLERIEQNKRWNAFVGELTKKAVITCADGGKNLENWKKNNAKNKTKEDK